MIITKITNQSRLGEGTQMKNHINVQYEGKRTQYKREKRELRQ